MIKVIFLILWIFLSLLTELSAAVSSIHQFVLKGESVHLTVEGLQTANVKKVSWKVNSTLILEYKLGDKKADYYGSFQQKTEFNSTDYSLYIKNLNETDDGLYSAEIRDNDGNPTHCTNYNLHVQEAVPKPNLNIMLLTLNSTGTLCSVSVNCSVGHNWVFCTCDQDQCKEVEVHSHVNINVTAHNGNIFCTGSNEVSNETQSEPMKPLCVESPHQKYSTSMVTTATVLVFFGVVLIAAIILWVKTFSHSPKNIVSQNTEIQEDTICSTQENPSTDCPLNANQGTDRTLYCTVMQKNDQGSKSRVPSSHSGDMTIYSVVKK